jgi:hypothetical protein
MFNIQVLVAFLIRRKQYRGVTWTRESIDKWVALMKDPTVSDMSAKTWIY